MNLLLVDDEVATIQILLKAIDWKKNGIDSIFTAYNTQTAREIVDKNDIDIIVSDIEMPQENGLDFIKWVQGVYPIIVNIILTGHADFNYARSAVSLGVFQFMLKPISHFELEQIVRDAVKLVEEEKSLEKTRQIGAYFQDKQWSEELAKTEGKSLRPEVLLIKKYMEKHYQESITRESIENLVHLNRDYINREFKIETGYTLMEYIQFFRIQIAKKLLSDTNESIASISMLVGYDSPAYLSKIFKRRTGITPIEYRNSQND